MVKQTRGYRVWDPASEDALKQGVRKHGLGAWEHIRKDPQFAILSDRTGVQLKDKWRNLVKFRHIDPDEQRTYKPKTQGPWSKKYKRERSQGLSGTASPASGDGGVSEEEGGHDHGLHPQAGVQANGSGEVEAGDPGSAVVLAGEQQQQQHELMGQRQSVRTSAQKRKAITDLALLLEGDGGDGYPNGSDEEGGGGGGEGDGCEGGGGAKRGRPRSVVRPMGRSSSGRHRKAQEDRRFGIYDRRRYGFGEDGSGGGGSGPRGRSYDGDGSEEGHGSDGEGHGGAHGHGHVPPPASRARRRGAAPSRRGGRGFSDDDEEDDDEDAPDEGSEDGTDEGGGGRRGGNNARRGRSGGSAAAAAAAADGGSEEYIIHCPCGVTYDDGEMMIECESCAAWAHVACLRRQMATAPDRFRYNFDTYHCAPCQEALQSLQQGLGPMGASGFGHAAGGLGERASPRGGFAAGRPRRGGSGPGPAGGGSHAKRVVVSRGDGSGGKLMDPQPHPHEGGDGDGDADTASEDSQRKASELSNILLGLANGRIGSSGGGRRVGGVLPNAPPPGYGGIGAGGGMSRHGAFGRTSTAPPGLGPWTQVGGDSGGAGGGDAQSPLARSASFGRTSSSGMAGTAAPAAAGGCIAAASVGGSFDAGSRLLLKPGPAAGEGIRKTLVMGPANSSGSKGRLDGAGSPPPIPDGGLPLFQATGGSGPGTSGGSTVAGAGNKIFKPIPKLATAPGLGEPARQPQMHLSAPKARPHPALQHGASQSSMQRMLEAANPLSAASAGGAAGSGGGAGGSSSRSLPLSSVLDAVGPLQVAAANLCRKASAAAAPATTASTGGAPAASDGVGSCDAAAAAGGLPPRPPSRPPSSMAREVANRIFGESDDDDAGGIGRPLSALRGATTDPWFLMPPSLSRAATPSAFIDTILRATPDIVPLTGTSPQPNLAAALAAVRSVSPGAAYLPALLAQQQQQAAAMQQFLQQSVTPPPAATAAANPLQPGLPSTASSAAAAAAAAGVILPPPPLARPPPPPFAPPPVPLTGTPGGWPPGVPPPLPPPPAPLHNPPSNGEPVMLHPVLRHLLLTSAQQHQHHHHQPPSQPGGVPTQPTHQPGAGPPPAQQQQPQQQPGSGLPGVDDVGIRIKEEIIAGPSPPPLSPHHHSQQQAQHQHQQPSQPAQAPQQGPQQQSHPAAASATRGPSNGGGGEDRSSRGGAGGGCELSVQPLLRGAGTLLPPAASGGGLANGLHLAGPPARDATVAGAAALAAAAAAAAAAGGGGSGGGAPPGLEGSGQSVAALLGLGMGGLHLNIMDHLRSSSPDPWGFFRTSTPGPEAILQGFLHPPPSAPLDINSLPWLKSATPPLSVDLMGHPPASGTDLQMDR